MAARERMQCCVFELIYNLQSTFVHYFVSVRQPFTWSFRTYFLSRLYLQDLVWTYELQGVGESRASISLGNLRCRAREKLEERLPVELAGSSWSEQDWLRVEAGTAGVKLEVIYPKDRSL